MKLRTGEITQLIERYDAAETEKRRDYYEYMSSREFQTDTFQEHVQKYANFMRTGDTASASEIAALEATMGATIPEELRELYGTLGKLRGGPEGKTLFIFSVAELAEKASQVGEVHPLGLIKMIRDCWGNDRYEFDPANKLITADQIARLDAEYTCIGWVEADIGLEAHEYIYFDRAGSFGSLFYHQDSFDELYEESLVPMLSASPANLTLSDILLKALTKAGSDEEDE